MVTAGPSRRRGTSGLGCLVTLVIAGIAVYYGINLGRVWWRYWEITDRMKTAARFSDNRTDTQLLAQLRADATEIGLPAEAARFRIQRLRTPTLMIVISTSYRETVNLPLLHRSFEFKPEVSMRR
jgi:hypothetical protein